MATYYQGNQNHPQHLSIGAVLINDKDEICCHHFVNDILRDYRPDFNMNDFYILMRETPEPGEIIENVVHRGLLEEFGAEAQIVDYLGSIKSNFKSNEVTVEKTTIYFLCKLVNQDFSRRSGDIESKSNLEWHTADFLIPKMKEQSKKYNRTDIDESEILERFKNIEKRH